ncbi:hypothetical protein IC615_18230 [Serratia ureilytica]
MSHLELTRRQLLQAGGVVMVSSLLPAPFNAFAAETVASPADLPLDRWTALSASPPTAG